MSQMNGTVRVQRKSLASQLDRMDGILDVLGDGLNEAVAGAVDQAVGTAVSSAVASVLNELLTNPAVVTRLRDALAQASPPVAAFAAQVPPNPTRVPYASRMRDHFETAKKKLISLATCIRAMLSSAGGKLKGWLSGVMSKAGACVRLVKPYRQPLLLSAGVGVAIGVTAFFAGPYFAAAAGGLAGFTTALGVQAAIAFRRLMGFGNTA